MRGGEGRGGEGRGGRGKMWHTCVHECTDWKANCDGDLNVEDDDSGL